MAERSCASDFCSDGRVVRMQVCIPAGDHGACALEQDTQTVIASLHPGVFVFSVKRLHTMGCTLPGELRKIIGMILAQ